MIRYRTKNHKTIKHYCCIQWRFFFLPIWFTLKINSDDNHEPFWVAKQRLHNILSK